MYIDEILLTPSNVLEFIVCPPSLNLITNELTRLYAVLQEGIKKNTGSDQPGVKGLGLSV